jgi:hypothetical protein
MISEEGLYYRECLFVKFLISLKSISLLTKHLTLISWYDWLIIA